MVFYPSFEKPEIKMQQSAIPPMTGDSHRMVSGPANPIKIIQLTGPFTTGQC